MESIIRSLYYIVDDWASQQYQNNEQAKRLMARQADLKAEIALRLGEDGPKLMDALTALNLELEDLHDEALFRAAMELGTQIAAPRRGPRTLERPQ